MKIRIVIYIFFLIPLIIITENIFPADQNNYNHEYTIRTKIEKMIQKKGKTIDKKALNFIEKKALVNIDSIAAINSTDQNRQDIENSFLNALERKISEKNITTINNDNIGIIYTSIFIPSPVFLNITSVPDGAAVFLDNGQKIPGETPIEEKVQVQPMEQHFFTFIKKGYESHTVPYTANRWENPQPVHAILNKIESEQEK